MSAAVAVYVAPPRLSLISGYTARWSIVGLAILAVAGRRFRLAAAIAAAGAGVGAPIYLLVVAGKFSSSPGQLWPYALSTAAVLALSAWQLVALVTRRHARDPVFFLAAQLAILLAGRWLFYLLSGLGLDPMTYGPQTIKAAAASEAPNLALALGAVGLGVSRSWQPALERLGFVRLRWWNGVAGILVAQLLLLSSIPANILTFKLTPHAWLDIRLVGHASFAHLPLWGLTLVAVLAAVSEETLFRGAVQPRVGILLTAVLFAMIHIQYGLTPILGMVFVHGIVYGLLRRHINTPTAIVAHFAYDDGSLFGLTVASNLVWAGAMAVLLLIPAWQNRHTISEWAGRGLVRFDRNAPINRPQ